MDSTTIGITNGCFDLIHIGHIYLLSICKSKVDKLIVALNSDESVRRIKGKDRPIYTEVERKFFLYSIKFVDEIVMFNGEEDLENIIKVTEPKYLFKGDQYQNQKITGQDIIESYGGEVFYVNQYSDWSSTKLIGLKK